MNKENLLNKDNILSKISKQDILQYYIPGAIPGKVMNSIFRVDNNASLYISKNGDHYEDLGDSRYVGDSFRSVMQLYGVEFFESLKIINKDFQLGLDGETVGDYRKIVKELPHPKKKPHTIIEVGNRDFTTRESEWWRKHLQTQESLNKEFVYGIGQATINAKEAYSRGEELAFHYDFPEIGKHKLYYPERDKKDAKWLSNVPINYVEGKNGVLGDLVIVQKSRKDRLVTSTIGVPCVNTQNEGIGAFTDDFIKWLIDKRVYIFFDSDETGIKQGKIITEKYGYNQLILPESLPYKDISAWVYNEGPRGAIQFFIQNKII